MSNKLEDLFNATDLRTMFSAPTEPRPETEIDSEIEDDLNTDDFETENVRQTETIEEDDYDPKVAAQSLVYGLQAIDQIVLAPVCYIKAVKGVGGVKAVKKMKQVVIKQASGQVLSDQEKTQLAALATFKKDLELLSGEILPNEKQTKILIERAIPYCMESKIKMGAGFGFWVTYAGALSEKVLKIVMS